LHRLAGVVRTAKALAVCRIKGCTAVAEFLDVIRKQPVLRRGLIAAVRILDPLASEAGVDEHLLTPSLMLFGMVDGICPLGLDGDCPPIRLRHQSSEHLDSRHRLLPLLIGCFRII
jgi:hypothetical protein